MARPKTLRGRLLVVARAALALWRKGKFRPEQLSYRTRDYFGPCACLAVAAHIELNGLGADDIPKEFHIGAVERGLRKAAGLTPTQVRGLIAGFDGSYQEKGSKQAIAVGRMMNEKVYRKNGHCRTHLELRRVRLPCT